MNSILQDEVIGKLPVAELQAGLDLFLQPALQRLPEERLRAVAKLAVQGILGSQSPLLTQMARGVVHEEDTIWPAAKRFYRFVWNKRFSHRDLLKGLYGMAQRTVAEYQPSYLVVALDPVNFEKPYTEKLEGVSTVMKSTPPPPKGQKKRLTPGYPAITATVVNLPEPLLTYANWFSYVTADFVSENPIRTTRALFPHTELRFVGDAGLDDQKIFHQMDWVGAQFTIQSCHNRTVEVYNDRLDRWEEELLYDLTASVPLPLKFRVAFTHARKVRHVDLELGWLMIRLPNTHQVLWALVAHDPDYDRDLILLTSIPLRTAAEAQAVYTEWRYRPRIEHTYRFDQEAGLDVEDMRVQTLERMRRVFALVLMAALFVYHVAHVWPHRMVLWLRRLGGKLGLASDLDGPYVLLAGIGAVFLAAATLAFAAQHPFPRPGGTCG
ncbi:MAG: hypothetical protein ACUVWZ_15125 [Anaerolineae bacterium]